MLVDRLAEKDTVSVVGVSAGASLTLHALAARKNTISGVICISGKVHNPETLPSRVFEHNPAFKDSLHVLTRSLSALSKKIENVYAPCTQTAIQLCLCKTQ